MVSPLRIKLLSDAAGIIEAPAAPWAFLSVHVGRSVMMTCERGGQSHRGLHVHGDIDIVPADTPSRWIPEQSDNALILSMPAGLLTEAAARVGLSPEHGRLRNRFRIRDPQIEHIAWALKAELESNYASGPAFLESLAFALATALVLRHSVVEAPIAASARASAPLPGHALRQAISYIEDNLADDLPLAEMAARCGMSASHFKQMFRRTTGVPVHRYVIQRRVERAQRMLLDTTLTIAEIALATGFAHQSHLALHMRRTLGVAPAALRSRPSETAHALTESARQA